MDVKQFGLSFEETLQFANKYSDLAATVEVEVPTDLLYKIADLTIVDGYNFKSWTITISLDNLDEFNSIITSIKQAL